MDPIPTTLIKQPVGGAVFQIDSPTGRVYTYDPVNPRHRTFVGVLEEIPETHKHEISKTNGCLAKARIKYRDDIREVMARLRAEAATSSSRTV
jgi:hypothetical protein